MSAEPYIPRLDSLADKVCRYFVRVPDDELLSREIAAKHGAAITNINHQLARAVEAGYLHVDGSVYSAGKHLAKFTQALDKHEQPRGGVADLPLANPVAGEQPPHKQRRVGKTFQCDLSNVVIESGLPIPPGHRTGMHWPGLFDRLNVGDSFTLPTDARSSVQKAATQYKRETSRELAVRVLGAGIRVWRVK